MRSPDFFLIGAPKCGTTALASYLKQHPEIFIPRKKELNYFGADLRIRKRPRLTRDEYLAFYAEAADQKRAGDASILTLYSPDALREIRDLCPTAGIIVMLRDPVEQMHAMHAENLVTGNESIADFAEALAAEPERLQGRRLRGMERMVVDTLCYRRLATYTDHVRRWMDAFGRENVHVIVFDDFSRATAATYRAVCEFLGVDPTFEPDVRVVNPSKRVRSQAVASLLKRTAPPVRAGQGPPLERLWRAVRSRIRRWNREDAPRRSMDPALKARLQAEFRPEVERLGALLGRDLTAWCR
jgi:hypothetical protein